MGQRVTDPAWWRERIQKCGGDLQRAMFEGSPDQFSEAHARHMNALRKYKLDPKSSVLDVGCGYGRLLTMMPAEWQGYYLGMDISPEFVAIAKIFYPTRRFEVADATKMPYRDKGFDFAISIWVKSMILREVDTDTWTRMLSEMRRVANKVIIIS